MKHQPTDTTALRRRIDHLRRLASGGRIGLINRYLGLIVADARFSAEKLERAGRSADAIPYYELIRDAYATTARLVPPEERTRYADMARFWGITVDGKKRATADRTRRRIPLPEVSREYTTVTKRWGSKAPGVTLRSGGQDLGVKVRKTEFKYKT